MTKAKEFRDQTPQELKAMVQDLSKELFQLRNERKVTRKIEKSHLLREKKKDRARILTVLREKEMAATS